MSKRTLFLFLIFCSLYVIVLAQQEESLVITTYYPSPYGSYRELTAYQMKIGTNYSGSGIGFISDGLIVEGNFGVRTSQPQATAHINGTLRIEQGGSANHVVCWRSDNTLGYCSTVVSGSGTCTCN